MPAHALEDSTAAGPSVLAAQAGPEGIQSSLRIYPHDASPAFGQLDEACSCWAALELATFAASRSALLTECSWGR